MNTIRRCSYYLGDAIAQDMGPLIERVQERIPSDLEYDTIVGTGLSGILVVPTVARALGKAFGVVRKEHELSNGVSHAESLYEGTMGRRWVLLDDFMCSGATCKRAIVSVHKEFHHEEGSWYENRQWDTEFVGFVEYDENRSRPWRSVEMLLERGGWDYIGSVEEFISTARSQTPAVPVGE